MRATASIAARRVGYFVLFAGFGLVCGLLSLPALAWFTVSDWLTDNWRYAGMAASKTGSWATGDQQ